MALFKKYGAILAVLGTIGVIAGAVTFLYHEFVTKELFAVEKRAVFVEIGNNSSSIAANALQIKQSAIQNHIVWLKEQLREIEKEFGGDIADMPPRVRADYLKLLRDLKEAEDALQVIQAKLHGG